MFETVIPEMIKRRSRLLEAETLPVSLALHATAIAIFLIAAHWNMAFPSEPPRVVRSYSLVSLEEPPPPPPPPIAAARAPAAPETPKPLDTPQLEVAPTMIPETIPHLATSVVAPPEEGVEGGVEGGVIGGVVGGLIAGEVGGVRGGTPGGVVIEPDGRVHIARDKKLPLYPLSQVYPTYPESARLHLKEGQLVVRYVIGRDGRVKEVTIVDPAEDKVFDDAAVHAIRNWRFRPMMKDGQATEVVHELTIFFRLEAAG
jgi:periplasmic protein TonB